MVIRAKYSRVCWKADARQWAGSVTSYVAKGRKTSIPASPKPPATSLRELLISDWEVKMPACLMNKLWAFLEGTDNFMDLHLFIILENFNQKSKWICLNMYGTLECDTNRCKKYAFQDMPDLPSGEAQKDMLVRTRSFSSQHHLRSAVVPWNSPTSFYLSWGLCLQLHGKWGLLSERVQKSCMWKQGKTNAKYERNLVRGMRTQ